jgi:hypothetical protein
VRVKPGLKGRQVWPGHSVNRDRTARRGQQVHRVNRGPLVKTTVLDLTGPAGPVGPKGNSGATGSQGQSGPQGLQGDAGAAGSTGSAGAIGAQGEAGVDGRDGEPADFRDRSRPPSDHTIAVVDQGPQIGFQTAVAVGGDGLPVIVYRDEATRTVKVAHCGTEDCSSGNTLTTPDDRDNVGRGASIAINVSGFPIISYRDGLNGFLRVLSCGNYECTEGNQLTDADESGSVNSKTSIVIGSDGLPVISYRDASADALRVLHCGDSDCSGGNTLELVDDSGTDGNDSSLTIGVDGLPVISFLGTSSSELVVIHCENFACTTRGEPVRMDQSGVNGFDSSIAIGADGLPVIAYREVSNGDLNVVHCGSIDCAVGNLVTVIDDDPDVGFDISLTIGADGLPIIRYADRELSILKFVHCGTLRCNNASSVVVIDSERTVLGHTAITVGRNGLPIIAYRDETLDALKVAYLSNALGVPFFRRR